MAFKIEINKKQWSEISFKLSEITDHLNTPHPSCFARHLLHKGEGQTFPSQQAVPPSLSGTAINGKFLFNPQNTHDLGHWYFIKSFTRFFSKNRGVLG